MASGMVSDAAGSGVGSAQSARPRHALPRRRARLLFLAGCTVAAGATLGAMVATRGTSPSIGATRPPARVTTWFAPYVSVTATPTYEFQAPYLNPAGQVVLGFVVSSSGSPCAPSWGGTFSLAQAGSSLDLDRRIRQLQDEGGDVMVSFGGAAGTELAIACRDVHSLESAYQAVVDRYHLDAIDFDLEGMGLDNSQAVDDRSKAVAQLQAAARAAHHRLAVWVTLPCQPSGMQHNALAVVRSLLAAGVRLSGVNVLAEDFGTPSDPSAEMGLSVEQALDAAHAQLVVNFRAAGKPLSSRAAWQELGATVMIGANNVPGETITLGDAAAIGRFAERYNLGRVSMWSLNRDPKLAYTAVFARLPGRVDGSLTGSGATAPSALASTSLPYPSWRLGESYHAGYKVVWYGYVYQAKWYTGENVPGVQVAKPWQTPWLLLGPVLPAEPSPTTTTLPSGTYPEWSAATIYHKGHRVLYKGLPYQAAFWTRGNPPDPNPLDLSSAPWKPLFSLPGEPPAA